MISIDLDKQEYIKYPFDTCLGVPKIFVNKFPNFVIVASTQRIIFFVKAMSCAVDDFQCAVAVSLCRPFGIRLVYYKVGGAVYNQHLFAEIADVRIYIVTL